MSENKILQIMSETIKNITSMMETNIIVGKPITSLDGTTIIPISKVTVGFMTGGGEYGDVKVVKQGTCTPFAGGSGGIVQIKPSGFIIDNGTKVKIMEPKDNPGYEKLIEAAIDFLAGDEKK